MVQVAPAVEQEVAALSHLRLVVMVSVTRREGGEGRSDGSGQVHGMGVSVSTIFGWRGWWQQLDWGELSFKTHLRISHRSSGLQIGQCHCQRLKA